MFGIIDILVYGLARHAELFRNLGVADAFSMRQLKSSAALSRYMFRVRSHSRKSSSFAYFLICFVNKNLLEFLIHRF